MIRTGDDAWKPKNSFGLDPFEYAPSWSFDRFGQTRTLLPDGRVVCVGGEHEDSYDPDFFIYNDVVLFRSPDDFDVFTYPVDVFPPTDAHSATLIGDELWLIGNVGYAGERGEGVQVLVLDLKTMKMRRQATRGDDPGWLGRQRARYVADEHAVVIGPGFDYRDRGEVTTRPARLSLTDATWRTVEPEALPWHRERPAALAPPWGSGNGYDGMDAVRRAMGPGHDWYGCELWPIGESSYVTVYEIVGGPGGFAVGEDCAGSAREEPPHPIFFRYETLEQAVELGVSAVFGNAK